MNVKMLEKVATAVWIIFLTCSTARAQVQSDEEQCPGEEAFVDTFNSEAATLNISDHDGHHCVIEDGYSNRTKDRNESSSCSLVAQLVRRVILRLDLTTEDCLEHGHNDTNVRPTSAEAYGYGFLMVFITVVVSLVGLSIIPLIYSKSPVGRQIYEYTYSFMIALAVSALISDAILHIIPHVFNVHEEDESKDKDSIEYLWKVCVIVIGIYMFYLLELSLHSLISYMNKRRNITTHDGSNQRLLDEDSITYKTLESNSDHGGKPTDHLEVVTKRPSSVIQKEAERNDEEQSSPGVCDLSVRRIRPVAWLIIIGDTMHNFGDGLAIGAAVSESLSLGISTTLAIVFHEIPHELGDFAILIKSGMHWFSALMLNSLSHVTAMTGLFVGVAVSQNTETANEWILAVTAGMFFYIGLVDLLPDLLHGTGVKVTSDGWKWWLRFLFINTAFLVSFTVLLLIALYEDKKL